jgi:2-keto-4-pentenoate hydratase/2-oxohepta-3-ene-1,7-dioic acid hydratase in catechol pathway
MRLATLRTDRGPRAALLVGDSYVDLQATDPSLPSCVKTLLSADQSVHAAAVKAANSPQAVKTPVASAKLHAPVANPQKVICIGLNYKDHAAESNMPIPKEPVLFSKFSSALIGHGENIVLPKVSTKVDYEAELVIVIGKRGKNIPLSSAMDYVAGYMVGHDVSARDWQLEKDGKQWMAGKTFDTFAPCGPTLVTLDEIKDPHDLKISLRLNGKTMQSSSTNQMIFRTPEILAYVSQVFTLEPGDLIFTGTPPGVGIAAKPNPVWMKPGDVAEVEIEGLGVLRNPVVAE